MRQKLLKMGYFFGRLIHVSRGHTALDSRLQPTQDASARLVSRTRSSLSEGGRGKDGGFLQLHRQIRIFGAFGLCVCLFGCIREDGFYPMLMSLPTARPEAIRMHAIEPVDEEAVSEKSEQTTHTEISQTAPAISAAKVGEKGASPAIETTPLPPSPAVATPETPPASTPKPDIATYRGFHSYFINREVRSENINMFPRWTGMLARFNAEAHTLDAICGVEQNTPCKLKDWKTKPIF